MYEVTINKVMNGFIVKVGCQTLVFQKRKTLIKELNRFLKDPDKMEKKYMEKYGPNATQTGGVVPGMVDRGTDDYPAVSEVMGTSNNRTEEVVVGSGPVLPDVNRAFNR